MSRYLEKHALYPPFFKPPVKKKDLIVVIPCHNEPDILTTLNNLNECSPVKSEVEVIIVVNHNELDSGEIKSRNKQTAENILSFRENINPWFSLELIEVEFSPKHAGVGLARKTGMDEAVRRLNDYGVISCLDADCTVASNYFLVLEKDFVNNPVFSGASIYYEHPLSGNLPESYYDAIIEYELHLRYYVHMQRRLKLPYAFHTVGSSMAVSRNAYERIGGMNKRKAGEDFYFIMKLIKYGGFTNCASTVVYPSPRTSDRVPFGTGKAINDMVSKENKVMFSTYAPSSFEVVEAFIKACLNHYLKPQMSITEMVNGWKSDDFLFDKLQEIKDNTSDYQSFIERYFKWFDGFQLMKLLHHLRDYGHPSMPVEEAAAHFISNDRCLNSRSLLDHYRKIDRST